MEKFTWKCVKPLFWKYFFLVYTTLHCQKVPIGSRSGENYPDPTKKVRIRPDSDPDPQPCCVDRFGRDMDGTSNSFHIFLLPTPSIFGCHFKVLTACYIKKSRIHLESPRWIFKCGQRYSYFLFGKPLTRCKFFTEMNTYHNSSILLETRQQNLTDFPPFVRSVRFNVKYRKYLKISKQIKC